jgi:hypothetical protein
VIARPKPLFPPVTSQTLLISDPPRSVALARSTLLPDRWPVQDST